MQVFDCFAAILKDLIPDKNLPTPIWLTRILVLFLIGNAFLLGGYFLLRDTAIGERYGFRPLIMAPQLSEREFVKIQQTTFANMARLKEDKPEIDAVFMFLGYNDRSGEFSYLDATNTMTLTQWITPAPFSPETIDELWQINRQQYQPLLINERSTCISNQIRELNQRRLSLTLRGNDSDRFVMCPLVNPKTDRTFGVIIATWTAPKEQLAIADKDMVNSVKTYTKLIETYILWQPNLRIQG